MTAIVLVTAMMTGYEVRFPRWVWVAIAWDGIMLLVKVVHDLLRLAVWTMEKMT